MSGPIRQLIGPTKTRLKGYLDKEYEPYTVSSNVSQSENSAKLYQNKIELTNEIKKIQNTLDLLNKKNQEWTMYIQSLKGDEQTREQDLYDTFASGEDGIIQLIIQAQDKLADYETMLVEIDYHLGQTKQTSDKQTSQPMPPTTFRPISSISQEREYDRFTSGHVSPAQPSPTRMQLKLPKFELPTFSGDPLKWNEFFDFFEASVHLKDMANVEKFNYLKGALRGRASEAIEGIAVTNSNYPDALDILKTRFGDVEIIKDALYSKLRQLSISNNRVNELRKGVDTMDKYLRQLKTLGEDTEHPSLVRLLLEKVGGGTLAELERMKRPSDVWTLSKLREYLWDLVIRKERIQRYTISTSSVNDDSSQSAVKTRVPTQIRKENTFRSSADSFMVKTHKNESDKRGQSKPKLRFKCIFCENQHYADDCDKFKTLDARKSKLFQTGRCYICFQPKHMASQCPKPMRYCFHCKGRVSHNRALCPKYLSGSHAGSKTKQQVSSATQNTSQISRSDVSQNSNETTQAEAPSDQKRSAAVSISAQLDNEAKSERRNILAMTSSNSMMLTAEALIVNQVTSLKKPATIFLDCGSQRSFIKEEFAKQLELNSVFEERLTVHTFSCKTPHYIDSKVVQASIMCKDGSFVKLQMNSLPFLTSPLPKEKVHRNDYEFLMSFPASYFSDALPLNQSTTAEPDVLIGSDFFWDIVEPQHKQQTPTGLYLISSKLGLMLTGKSNYEAESRGLQYSSVLDTQIISHHNLVMNYYVSADKPLAENSHIPDLWSLDAIGIHDSPETNDDDVALQQFNSSVSFENGRYHVIWPWKKSIKGNLPDNYALCLGRFKSLVHRFQADPELLRKYNDILLDQEKKGIIEKASHKPNEGTVCHYLPHHPVITPQKNTTKVRIVYDASAKANKQSVSLNECQYRGPVLLPDLVGLLVRFRTGSIGVIADIEKAFLQIGLKESERDVTRFLWLTDPSTPKIQNNIQVFRFTRVLFGAISSPFLLNGTVKYHLQKEGSQIASQIASNIYVDNLAVAVNNTSEAMELYQAGKAIFAKASMNLREWSSNSEELIRQLPSEDRVVVKTVKVLGLRWYLESDSFQLSCTSLSKTESSSKRQILQAVAGIFDPLGFASPIILNAKLFIQKLWDVKKGWDDSLEAELLREWNMVLQTFHGLEELMIPRYIGMTPETQNTLAIFTDASQKAYAAVAYLRMMNTEGQITTNLILAKTRLSPKQSKKISIPRLELLSMLIGVRMLLFLEQVLHVPIQRKILWTDSQCCLDWLKTAKPLSLFVENRLREIKKAQGIYFCHVDSKQNPADLASRGMSACDLQNSQLWWKGPAFLTLPESQWSIQEPSITPEVMEKINSEVKGNKYVHEFTMASVREEPMPLSCEKFSTLLHLLMATVYVLRFIRLMLWSNLSAETQKKYPMFQTLFSIATHLKDEVQAARLLWDHFIQRKYFSEIFAAIRAKKSLHLIKRFNLQIDSRGLLRTYSRLQYATELPFATRCPKLLPMNSHYTTLVIQYFHKRVLHGGVQMTLAAIRSEYWILKGRAAVKAVIHKCVICRKFGSGPYPLPPMPPLPVERVHTARPFQFIGLDYLGPVIVKTHGVQCKCWIVLFTCFVIRAIHLDFVPDLSAPTFLNCLRRFIACRGKPDLILSDNASQFKLTKKAVQHAWTSLVSNPDVVSYCGLEEIKWSFITEKAPWQGGLYERMVSLVKSAFKKAVGRRMLHVEEFKTLLAEIQAVINCRPLTFIHSDGNNHLILCPADFLVPKGSIGTLQLEENHNDPEWQPPSLASAEKLVNYWKSTQQTLDKFWSYWKQEYLVSLREQLHLQHKAPRVQSCIPPTIDAIVQIEDEDTTRGSWKLGRITELHKSSDEEIRQITVRLPSGRTIKRPPNKLYPLELCSCDTVQPVTSNNAPILVQSLPAVKSFPIGIKPLVTTVFFILFCFFTCTESRKCPEKTALEPIESQRCVQTGIAIMRIKDGGTLCWQEITCPMGHLDGHGKCDRTCPCPMWALRCSFYEGPVAQITSEQKDVLVYEKPNACSFVPDKNCNAQPTHVQLNQILLHDNTKYFVKNLQIIIVEPTENEFVCVGKGSTVGTPRYCKNHPCASSGTRFCYYKTNEQLYFISSDGTKIPIKAWGSVATKIYGAKAVSADVGECTQCSLTCIQAGVRIHMTPGVGLVEACAKPFCYKVSQPKEQEEIIFPAEVSLLTHTFNVKIWAQGFLIKDFGIQCPAAPYCEMIKCYLCKERFANPQCASNVALVIFFMMLYFASITLVCLCKLLKLSLKCMYYCSYTGFICTKFLIQFCRKAKTQAYTQMYLPVYTRVHGRKPSEEEEEESSTTSDLYEVVADNPTTSQPGYKPRYSYQVRRKGKMPRTAGAVVVTAIIVIELFSKVNSCAEVTSLQAQRTTCSAQKNGTLECVINEVTRMALSPQGQESCLLIRDPGGEPLGTLMVEVEKIYLQCIPKNEYFTRSYTMNVVSHKRCPTSGSCSGDKCGGVRIDSKIRELDGPGNRSLGFTHCVDSCGCAGYGCFFCTAGCLFYRVYAEPSSDTVFEVFSCPTWEYIITVNTRLMMNGKKTQTHAIKLRPGVGQVHQNMKLTIPSITTPPLPILGSMFLTDSNRVVMIRASASGQPISGTIGALQCKNREKAQKFDCYLPKDICICDPQEESVSCTCDDMVVETLFEKQEYVIPLRTQGLSLSGTGKRVYTELNNIASLELQISLEGLRLATKVDKNQCTIKPLEFGGCYSCFTGAKLKFTCTTDFGDALAHVQCGKATFATLCSSKGITETASLAFTHAKITETCTTVCPAGTTTFKIEGVLVFIDKERIGNISNIVVEGSNSTQAGIGGIDFGFLAGILSGKWLTAIIVIIIIIILLAITIPLAPILLQFLIVQMGKLGTVIKTQFNKLFSKRRQSKSVKTT